MLASLMQASLVNNLKTGNTILDVFISGALLSLITWLISNYAVIWGKTKSYMEFFSRATIQSEISFFGEEMLYNGSETRNYSAGFCAMLHYLHNSEVKEVKAFEEVRTARRSYADYYEVGGNLKNDRIMLRPSSNLTRPFRISKNVFCELSVVSSVSDKTTSHVERKLTTMRVFSFTLSPDELKAFAEEAINAYNTFIKEDVQNNQYYFVTTMQKKANSKDPLDDLELAYDEYKFRSSRAFTNIFYSQKDEVKRRLDLFLNNRQWYHERGVPYSLGFLFYGPPGTGKTSTIKAIANYTKRHLVEVSLGRIKTYRDLLKVFQETTFCEKFIPSHKIIYVIEDIDCLDDIVMSRDGKVNKEFGAAVRAKAAILQNNTDEDNEDEDNEGKGTATASEVIKSLKYQLGDKAKAEFERFKEYEKRFNRDPLTLSHLLNVIDGILETPGRILIISSNHPERLDEALIRPGRIDMKVEFGLSNVTDTINILEMFFKQPVPKDSNYVAHLPNLEFTAAQIYNICFQSKNMEDALERLYFKAKLSLKAAPALDSSTDLNRASPLKRSTSSLCMSQELSRHNKSSEPCRILLWT